MGSLFCLLLVGCQILCRPRSSPPRLSVSRPVCLAGSLEFPPPERSLQRISPSIPEVPSSEQSLECHILFREARKESRRGPAKHPSAAKPAETSPERFQADPRSILGVHTSREVLKSPAEVSVINYVSENGRMDPTSGCCRVGMIKVNRFWYCVRTNTFVLGFFGSGQWRLGFLVLLFQCFSLLNGLVFSSVVLTICGWHGPSGSCGWQI